MSSQWNNINLLKQLPFYEKTIKPKINEFATAKLLYSYHFLKNP